MDTPAHNDSAKVFMVGKSQAVRLPKKYRFAEGCDEVSIRQVGRSLILSPRFADWAEFWAHTPPFDDDMVKAVLDRKEGVEGEDPQRASFDE